jgi:hypothetical protein
MLSSLKVLLRVFAAALLACSAVPSKPDTAAFDPGPWLDDLAVARTAIVTKYAGLEWDVNERGLDVNQVYAAARERVSLAADAGDARRAFERFADQFGDRHVHFLSISAISIHSVTQRAPKIATI